MFRFPHFRALNDFTSKFHTANNYRMVRNICNFHLVGKIGPKICVKYFLLFPQKNLSLEKTETNYVLTFQFLMK